MKAQPSPAVHLVTCECEERRKVVWECDTQRRAEWRSSQQRPWYSRCSRPQRRRRWRHVGRRSTTSSARTASRARRPARGTSAAAASPSIQGFATDISVNRGRPSRSRSTRSPDYRLDIYRMGYYGGDGRAQGRDRAAAASLPQTSRTASATAPPGCRLRQLGACRHRGRSRPTAVSGIYFAQARARGSARRGQPHRVRRPRRRRRLGPAVPDLGHDLAGLQRTTAATASTSEAPGRRRPRVQGQLQPAVHARAATAPEDWVFNAEYPMVRWLEPNGYDVSYSTGVDSDRRGALILEHKVFLSVGHDEYWSGAQRANVEAARDAGVNLAFFSGNEMFWKTRWENSIDGRHADRTLVSYKETHANAKIDPTHDLDRHMARPALQPARRRRPAGERADRHDLHVSTAGTAGDQGAGRGRARCGSGATRRVADPVAGRHRDACRRHARLRVGRGPRQRLPAGRADPACPRPRRPASRSSWTTAPPTAAARHASPDAVPGTTPAARWSSAPGPSSGRGASTATTTAASGAPSRAMQQATVNLLADMGVQPATPQAGLAAATAVHRHGTRRRRRSPLRPAGAVVDAARRDHRRHGERHRRWRVAASRCRSTTARPGTRPPAARSWQYTWTPHAPGTPRSAARAVDDSGNLERRRTAVPVVVGAEELPLHDLRAAPQRPPPTTASRSSWACGSALTRTVRHRPALLQGRRAHRHHVGHLWTADGKSCAATFPGSPPLAGRRSPDTPVTVSAGTTYVARITRRPAAMRRPQLLRHRKHKPATARAGGRADGERRVQVRPARLPDRDVQQRATTGSTWCSIEWYFPTRARPRSRRSPRPTARTTSTRA